MWFVISLALFAAAVFFWQLGDKRRLNYQPAPGATNGSARTSFTLTNPATAVSTAGAASAVVSAAPSAPTPIATGSVLDRSNAVPFRVSNTMRPFAELVRDNRAILLRNAVIDTAQAARPEIPEHLRAKGEPGAYVVQARDAITDVFRQRVLQSGAEIVSYIPNNAMLVRATPEQVRRFANSPQTQAIVPFEPYYKLDGMLLPLAVNQQLSPYEKLNVVAFPRQTARVRESIAKLGGEVLGAGERTPMGENLVAKVPADALARLAQVPEVQIVSVRSERRLMNDLSRVRVRISQNSTTAPPAGQYSAPAAGTPLTGDGVMIGIADSGADSTHPDLTGRILGLLADDTSGHGTHVAGTILGNGSQSGSVGCHLDTNVGVQVSDAQGSACGAFFSGMAPGATGYVHNFNLPDATKQELAATNNIPIVNNSWAYGLNDYDIFAASYDAAVRDSLPFVTGQQQVTHVFAAGNSGGGNGDGLGGIPGSILSPATAKNVITVGAGELYRRITNEVYRNCRDVTNVTAGVTNVSVVCETNRPWFPETDSLDQVMGMSARGNVGIGIEGPFGRFKPDVIAPGGMLVSTRNANYAVNSNNISVSANVYNGLTIARQTTNLYSIGVPPNAIQVDIFVTANNTTPSNTPVNFPLWIDAALDALPVPPAIGSNWITLTTNGAPFALTNGTLYYNVGNQWSNQVNFDLVVLITFTNDVGNYYQALDDLNAPLAPYYRYEEGTSMAAAVVSGFLALVQEFFAKNFLHTNSPALNKALLINGARSLGIQYNFQTLSTVNQQGWGQVNISNSVPPNFGTGANSPLRFYDQDSTNALATGEHDVYTITIPASARSSPLRVSLVWTDPAANPVSSLKLVNDLDLFVDGPGVTFVGTNAMTRTARWLGNNFSMSSDFTAPITLVETNGAAGTNITQSIEQIRDTVNNVENVFIAPPLGATYTVVVRAHRVNVNAVNSHTNKVAQDYALVICSGDVSSNAPGITAAGPVRTNNPAPFFTAMQQAGMSNTVTLLNQRVGANSPLIGSTNGTTNQWSFYTFTNVNNAAYRYVAIATFLPPNLGFLQPRFANPERPRYRDGDIDLYVARSSKTVGAGAITNLNTAVIAATDKSTGRNGTEYLLYSNAAPGEVFYIGVKSEDQQSATFGLFATSSDKPFSSRDTNGNIILTLLPQPAPIPDGSPDSPDGVYLMAFCEDPATIQRVIVSNIVTHENGGDLIGILTHESTSSQAGQDQFATLNNHRYWAGTEETIYDDSGLNDVTNSVPSEGPGTLRNFTGEDSLGLWAFYMIDNALFHTGAVEQMTVVIEPASTNDTNLVNITRRVPPLSWLYAPANVPSDAVSMEVCVSDITHPVELYIRRGDYPDEVNYDYHYSITNPGACVTIGLGDSPPLIPGARYYIGVFNPDPVNDTLVTLRVDVLRFSLAGRYFVYTQNQQKQLLDDAVTTSSLFVTNRGKIADLRVGLRVEHERASDLVFHLVSPGGTRLLLMENRGRTNTQGIGRGIQLTNVYPSTTSGDFNASTNTLTNTLTSGLILIDYDFYSIPDRLMVFFQGAPIFDSGLISGSGVFSIPFGPGNPPTISIVMNPGNNTNAGTLWTYQATVVSDYLYTTFTENTNLTTTPIKFADPPYTNAPSPFSSVVLRDGFDTFLSGAYPFGIPAGSYIPGTGWFVESNDVDIVGIGYGMTTNLGPDTPNWALDLSGNTNGAISTNLVLTAGAEYVLSFAYTGFGPNRSAMFDLSGITNFIISVNFSTQWYQTTIVFRATAPFTKFTITSLNPEGSGLFIDSFLIDKNFTNSSPITSYFLPEESLHPFFGEEAYGLWTLEVWDNRLGGAITNTPTLLSWRLEIAYPQTNAPSVTLTNGTPFTNRIAGAEVAYFAVDVPCSSGFITNTLTCLTSPSAGVNLIFNPFTQPGVNPANDVRLLANVTNTGIHVLQIGSAPLGNSARYYLAVTNTNPNQTNDFVLRTDVLCGSGIPELTNGVSYCETNRAGAMHYYSFTVPPNVIQCTFAVLNPTTNVDLYLRRDLPPTTFQADYRSTNSGTADEIITVATNSVPIPIITSASASAEWFLGVLNPTAGDAYYCVRVTLVFAPDVGALPLDIFTNLSAAAGSTNYYVVNVQPGAGLTLNSADFGLWFISGGNLDFYVKDNPPLPGPGVFDFATVGTNGGGATITVDASTTPPINAGTWFLTVVNTNAAVVNYQIYVSQNSSLVAGPKMQAGTTSYNAGSLTFTWTAPAGQTFQVQYSDTLPANWQDLGSPVTSASGIFTFTAPPGGGSQRFFRLLRIQ
jgi:subtilisin-like proprotein convertase family protein